MVYGLAVTPETCPVGRILDYNKLNANFGKILDRGIKKGLLPHAEVGWTLMSIYNWQRLRGFL